MGALDSAPNLTEELIASHDSNYYYHGIASATWGFSSKPSCASIAAA